MLVNIIKYKFPANLGNLSTTVEENKAVLLLIIYGCESWTIKKAERQRTDAFELWH